MQFIYEIRHNVLLPIGFEAARPKLNVLIYQQQYSLTNISLSNANDSIVTRGFGFMDGVFVNKLLF